MNGHDSVAEALLSGGADAGITMPPGLTALGWAARLGAVRVLAVFLRHGGVGLNGAAGDMDRTALHAAARNNQVGAIDLLVEAGVDPEAKDVYGKTPLHVAARLSGQAAVALLKHGANINARDIHGETPLHLVALGAGIRGAAETVELLLRWGAYETATANSGKTPADICGRYNGSDTKEVERVRKLLANAPVAREAWRRRGLLVTSRALPEKVLLTTRTPSRGEWMDLMGRVLGVDEEGVFRTIVGYL